MKSKLILDACCGGRMFWRDKQNHNVLFMDNRSKNIVLCNGQCFKVSPDIIADFRNMPFKNESFYHIVFDPPHLTHGGNTSWIIQKYGKLDKNGWKKYLKQGFDECMRVLKIYGTLVFKWSEADIAFCEVIKIFEKEPLYHFNKNRTYFAVFFKEIPS